MRVPTTFPAQANTITRNRGTHLNALLMALTSVLSPLIAKNRGNNNPATKSSFLISDAPKCPFGITNPNINVLNMEWMPIASVMKTLTIRPISIIQMWSSLTASPSGVCRIIHPIAGNTTNRQKSTNALLERTTHRDSIRLPSILASAMAKASRIHAHVIDDGRRHCRPT
ncbi:hypothetical protein AAC387_Pa01g2407 [Persea americana]